jgi:hypothetical protein
MRGMAGVRAESYVLDRIGHIFFQPQAESGQQLNRGKTLQETDNVDSNALLK